MNPSGDTDLLVAARGALLDALDALREQHSAVVLIGAQAVYLHTGRAQVALAEATKDSDLALDPRRLADLPLIEAAMTGAGFALDQSSPQPGSWLNPAGIPVDLMVPDMLAGGGGRRGARIPPHSKRAARRATGLEAAVVDHAPMAVRALAHGDDRVHAVQVASPSALLVAKLYKLGDREHDDPARLVDKDAHDIYRLLVAIPTDDFAAGFGRLRRDNLAGPAAVHALAVLDELFGKGPTALGSRMAGRAEEGIGQPDTVAASVAILAQQLLEATQQ